MQVLPLSQLSKLRTVLLQIAMLCFAMSACTIKINDDRSGYLNGKTMSALKNQGHSSLGELAIKEIDANILRTLCLKNKETKAFVWATYCKPCIEKLGDVINESKETNVPLILIANDYSMEKVQSLLGQYDYKGETYILSASAYGTNTRKKLLAFHEAMTDDFVYAPAFPQIYILNKKGKVIAYKSGSSDL